MKKTAVILIATIMIVCFGIVGVFAADRDRVREHKQDCTAVCETNNCNEVCETVRATQNCNINCDRNNYVDEDNNGVCDNYSESCKEAEYCYENYADSDNDGICDNYSENCNNNDYCGENYEDANNDNVCDNYQAPKHNQNGKHCKNRCN